MMHDIDDELSTLLSAMTPEGRDKLRSIVRQLIDHTIDRALDSRHRHMLTLSSAIVRAGAEILGGLRELSRAVRELRPPEPRAPRTELTDAQEAKVQRLASEMAAKVRAKRKRGAR